jgi:hypothetical protein
MKTPSVEQIQRTQNLTLIFSVFFVGVSILSAMYLLSRRCPDHYTIELYGRPTYEMKCHCLGVKIPFTNQCLGEAQPSSE